MNEVVAKSEKPKRKIRQKKISELDELRYWINSLALTHPPVVHVNGKDHSNAVIVVDFGTPLGEVVGMTPEQSAEFIVKMKSVTKSLFKSDVNVRIQNDPLNGIWWSSVN